MLLYYCTAIYKRAVILHKTKLPLTESTKLFQLAVEIIFRIITNNKNTYFDRFFYNDTRILVVIYFPTFIYSITIKNQNKPFRN